MSGARIIAARAGRGQVAVEGEELTPDRASMGSALLEQRNIPSAGRSAGGYRRPGMGAPAGHAAPLELLRMAIVARRYFVDGRNKSEIADELGISRFKVARIIDAGLAQGQIKVSISIPSLPIDPFLSERLQEVWSLKHVLVLAARDLPPDVLRSELGALGAILLAELLAPDDALGVSWGRTLDYLADALPVIARCEVVQIVGGIQSVALAVNSLDVARRIGLRAGGRMYLLHAPLLSQNAHVLEGLLRDPDVAETIGQFRRLTKAIVAIGSWNPPDSLMYKAIPSRDRHRLLDRRIKADICGTLVLEDGTIAATHLDRRIMAISADELRAVPDVIAVAGGQDKADAIAAVLRSGLVNTLVTDATVAERLLHA